MISLAPNGKKFFNSVLSISKLRSNKVTWFVSNSMGYAKSVFIDS